MAKRDPQKAVIDTVTMSSVLRVPKGKKRTMPRATVLDAPIKGKRAVLVVDIAGGIVDEWEKTAGPDVRVMVYTWAEWNGIKLVQPKRSLPERIRRCRPELRLHDQIDRLVVRTALAEPQTVIVSDDSDFWDPTAPNGGIGNDDAPMCMLLCVEGVQVITLRALLQIVS